MNDSLRQAYPDRVLIHLIRSSETETQVTPTVWDLDSARLLRQYGICGLLTGTLPLIPQQNVFLGLPMQLIEEEVVCLMRQGQAVLIDESTSYVPPSPQVLAEWNRVLLQEIHTQRQQSYFTREKQRIEYLEKKQSKPIESLVPPTEEQLSSLPYYHTTVANSSQVEWYQPTVYLTLSSARQANIWTFPSTQNHIAQSLVFEDLRNNRDMWLVRGLRFGGEFSVYPGDPLRYHAHYTTSIHTSSETLPSLTLIASGRLGTAVKKSHLICSVSLSPASLEFLNTQNNQDKFNDFNNQSWGQVDYFSLSWAGFGT